MDQKLDTTHQNSSKNMFVILLLIAALIISLGLVFQQTNLFTRASFSNTSPPVMANSYLFASPLQAKADGKEMIRLTAFILDGRGLGVGNLEVRLTTSQSTTILAQQPYTDETGKAVFDLSSNTPGTLYAEASVYNQKIPQKIKLIFY